MSRAKGLAVEVVVLVVVSVCLGLAGNALHARGIKLGRDYFPTAKPRGNDTGNQEQVSPSGQPVVGNEDPAPSKDREPGRDANQLPEHGLQVVSAEEACRYYTDTGQNGGAIVFVDARNDEQYADGHIPGALQVDHYKQDAYLPRVIDQLRVAEMIIVYCDGGDCEDSQYLASDLVDVHGLPYENVYLFEGGMKEWRKHGWPIKKGPEP